MDASGIIYLLNKHAPKPRPKLYADAEEIRILAAKQTLKRVGGHGKKMPAYALKTIHEHYMRLQSLGKTGKLFGVTKESIRAMFIRYGLSIRKKNARPFIEYKGVRYSLTEQGCYRSNFRKGRALHRVIWEEINGPIPRGYMLAFRSENRQDFSPRNLNLISRKEFLREQNYKRFNRAA